MCWVCVCVCSAMLASLCLISKLNWGWGGGVVDEWMKSEESCLDLKKKILNDSNIVKKPNVIHNFNTGWEEMLWEIRMPNAPICPTPLYINLSLSSALVMLLSHTGRHSHSLCHPHPIPLFLSASLSLQSLAVIPIFYLQSRAIDTVISDPVGRDQVIEISCGLCLSWYYKTSPGICLVTLHIWVVAVGGLSSVPFCNRWVPFRVKRRFKCDLKTGFEIFARYKATVWLWPHGWMCY